LRFFIHLRACATPYANVDFIARASWYCEREFTFFSEQTFIFVAPRTRSIPDNTILDHACQLLAEHGAEAVTFAQVAQRCGLAPPTLVQRFGHRAAMLEAMAGTLARHIPAAFGGGTSPLTALQAGVVRAAPTIQAALNLAATGTGVAMATLALELRKQISYALAAAIEAGELPHCDVAHLARTIQISVIGAVAAARLEGGDPAEEAQQAVAAQLASYV
jgi:AcrR family transcriptional regulator